MTETIHAYGSVMYCPKCYASRDRAAVRCLYTNNLVRTEKASLFSAATNSGNWNFFLVLTCFCCGYDWAEYPADYSKQEALE